MKKTHLVLLAGVLFVVSSSLLMLSCAGTPSRSKAHPEFSVKKQKCSSCHDDMANLDHDQKLWGEGHATLLQGKKGTCTLCHNMDTCGTCHSD